VIASDPGAGGGSASERLDSWKEIAGYLRRGVTTVQRWERTEGLPVHRLPHSRSGSVHAYRHELDQWWHERSARLATEEAEEEAQPEPPAAPEPALVVEARPRHAWRRTAAVSLAVLVGAVGIYLFVPRARTLDRGRVKLAVLPFANLSGNAEDDYLADGVTEEITTVLGRLRPERLGVIARTSVAGYKDAPKPVRVVARELGVDYVLEGSVRHSGGRLRVTAQLIEVGHETYLWADSYERELSDALAVEGAMAQAVAQRLSIQLLPGSKAAPSPPSREAHVAYLKGLYFWNKRSEAGLRRAIEYFREALDLDPGYAQAHAGLSTSYARLATSADAISLSEARGTAEAAALRALEIAPELPEGHAALAVVRCQFDWNWKECERELARTVALDPNYASGHHWLGEHLVQLGRFQEGLQELRQAQSLDPISPTIHTSLGIASMYARRYDDALASYASALELDPRFLLAHRVQGLTLVRMGRIDEGLASLQGARRIDPGSAHAAADLGYALASVGRGGEGRAMLAELEGLARQRSVSPYDFAVVHAGLGDVALSLDALEKAYAERANGLRWLKVEPIFDGIRATSRFRELQRRVGLPN
jgi:TolB-like protein/Flp pilus assembly protein TadD